MPTTLITPAGFVVIYHGDDRIYGCGTSANDARIDANDMGHVGADFTDYTTCPATYALLRAVTELGGAIPYGTVNGVACTVDEEANANAED